MVQTDYKGKAWSLLRTGTQKALQYVVGFTALGLSAAAIAGTKTYRLVAGITDKALQVGKDVLSKRVSFVSVINTDKTKTEPVGESSVVICKNQDCQTCCMVGADGYCMKEGFKVFSICANCGNKMIADITETGPRGENRLKIWRCASCGHIDERDY